MFGTYWYVPMYQCKYKLKQKAYAYAVPTGVIVCTKTKNLLCFFHTQIYQSVYSVIGFG